MIIIPKKDYDKKQLDNLKKYAIIGVATIALLALVIALIKLL